MRLFLVRTARRLGYPSVRHLLASGITSTEIVEMAAVEILDPPAEVRIDAGFASLMSLVYNRTRGKGERGRKAHDFLPQWGPPDPEAVREKIKHAFGMMRKR